jgi:hypothetical protein
VLQILYFHILAKFACGLSPLEQHHKIEGEKNRSTPLMVYKVSKML